MDQTERRILEGQKLPPAAKRVSLFEMHADILRKRERVVYGHKVCVSFGKSGVVLSAQITRGNPADSQLSQPAIEQVMGNTGRIPHDVAMDAGFASGDNVAALKGLGVQRVTFSADRGIDGEAACGSRRVRRKLSRFRAGVEELISWLKRSLLMGRSRCPGQNASVQPRSRRRVAELASGMLSTPHLRVSKRTHQGLCGWERASAKKSRAKGGSR